MPHYDYQLVGGTERIERFHSMSEAPNVGETREFNGKKYIRIISVPTLNTQAIAVAAHGYPYESRSMPNFDPAVAKTSDAGFTVVRSQNHERELMARTGRIRD